METAVLPEFAGIFMANFTCMKINEILQEDIINCG